MSHSASPTAGPHSALSLRDNRERFAAALFDRLWERYRARVTYVATYERVIREAGATFFNDHIAFRTFAWQRPFAGIGSISRIFEALGYVPAGCYHFADKHLSAVHFQHPNAELPKLFISELKTWELSDRAREIIGRPLAAHREPIALDVLTRLADPKIRPDDDELLDQAAAVIQERPWPAPQRSDVQELNSESQYAAWVLVHGYEVNHFTSLINSHGVPALDDIEKTVAALKEAGVPMKAEIEGARGSKLRQTATEAVVIDVPVSDGTMPWTYAYFELAERGEVTDAETGRRGRFEGFLGPQATNLFEMTRVKQ